MSCQGALVQTEEDTETHNKRVRWEKIFLATDHKTTNSKVLASRSCLANLMWIHPPSTCNNFWIPCFAVANLQQRPRIIWALTFWSYCSKMFRVNLELTVKHPAWFSVNGGIGVSGLWFLIIVLEAPCNSACTYLLHIKSQPAASMRNSWNKMNIW